MITLLPVGMAPGKLSSATIRALIAESGVTFTFQPMHSPLSTSQKSDRTQRRSRQKYRRACLQALGGLGFRVFKEFVSLYGNGPILPLTVWVEAWQWGSRRVQTGREASSRPLPTPKPLHKATVSNWRSALHSPEQKAARVPGLAFYVQRLELIGRPLEGKPWTGALLLIYERTTNSLFHYVAAADSKVAFPAGALWFALGKAEQLLRDKQLPEPIPTEKKWVFLPQKADGLTGSLFFREAVVLLEKCREEGTPLAAMTHAKKPIELLPEEWDAGWYSGAVRSTLRVELESPRDVRLHLRKMAAATSAEMRRLQAILDVHMSPLPFWRGVNRPGTDPNWLQKLQKKRVEAKAV